MTCQDFLARLQTLLDQRRDPQADATLCRHAASCEACGERLEAQDRLFLALELAVRAAGESVRSGDALVMVEGGELRADAGRSVAKLAGFGLASVLAAFLSAWGVFHSMRPSREMTPTRPVASLTAPNVVASRSDGESAGARASKGELATRGQRGGALPGPAAPSGTAKADRMPASLSPVRAPSADFDWDLPSIGLQHIGLQTSLERFNEIYETVANTPPIPEGSVPQVDQLAEEVRPLAQPFVSVLNVLRRSFPGAKAPSDQPTGDQSLRTSPRVHLT